MWLRSGRGRWVGWQVWRDGRAGDRQVLCVSDVAQQSGYQVSGEVNISPAHLFVDVGRAVCQTMQVGNRGVGYVQEAYPLSVAD